MRQFVTPIRWFGCASTALIFLGLMQSARADEDTSRRLRQSLQLSTEQKTQSVLVPEASTLGEGVEGMVINGQLFSIDANVNDMGKAIYLGINHQLWADVQRLLPKYQALVGHDLALVGFAQAALARAEGDYPAAIAGYRQLLQRQPDFLRVQLELGRTLYENHQNTEAQAWFQQIELPADAPGLQENVAGYVDALAVREAWHGSVAIGPVHNSNLNQSTASVSYFPVYEGDELLGHIERRMPSPVADQGLAYEASLSKQKNLSGQHGLMLRGLLYGNEYATESSYSDSTASVYGGYQYRTARTTLAVAPLFEFNWQNHQALYKALGAKIEWQYALSPKALVNVDAERKRLAYHNGDYAHNNGWQSALFVTGTYALPKNWLVFGGLDWLRKNAAEGVNAYHQQGARLGVAKSFNAGVETVFFAAWRHKQYDAYSQVLAAKRSDHEQTYTAIVKMPKWRIAGMTPSFLLRHNRVSSNVGWLYAYRKNEVSLKLEKYF
ncbi:MAG: DUF560 domain-containing protein [Neisseriaceae bacterium]|nr:DUF560 domain-containing protein [Neisseriaceae bacterium]MBP6861839.1 DUF560 domain-containing protein [Neisseriaceae bacterium]